MNSDPIHTESRVQSTKLALWCSLSVLPSAQRDHLERVLTDRLDEADRDGRESMLTHECRALIASTQAAIASLTRVPDHKGLTTLEMSAWPTHTEGAQHTLAQICEREGIAPPPPLFYWVELIAMPRSPDASKSETTTLHLTLTPAELALITRLDPDIGRRIGDELDGQRPEA